MLKQLLLALQFSDSKVFLRALKHFSNFIVIWSMSISFWNFELHKEDKLFIHLFIAVSQFWKIGGVQCMFVERIMNESHLIFFFSCWSSTWMFSVLYSFILASFLFSIFRVVVLLDFHVNLVLSFMFFFLFVGFQLQRHHNVFSSYHCLHLYKELLSVMKVDVDILSLKKN